MREVATSSASGEGLLTTLVGHEGAAGLGLRLTITQTVPKTLGAVSITLW